MKVRGPPRRAARRPDMRVVTLVVAVCLLGLTLASTAQTSLGIISGTVKDSAGAPLPGVTIRISKGGVSTQTQTTDAKGAFAFARVPAAEYELTAILSGFAPFTARITVRPGATETVAVVLKPQQVAKEAPPLPV